MRSLPGARWALLSSVAAVTLMATVARGAPVEGRWTKRLVAAAAAGDVMGLERAAQALGAAGLSRALRAKNAGLRRAAVAAAPYAQRPWTLRRTLLSISSGTTSEALEAARSLRHVVEGLRPSILARYEEHPSRFAPMMAALLRRAGDTNRRLDLREADLRIAAALANLVAVPRSARQLLKAPAAGLRVAAVELFAGGHRGDRSVLAQVLLEDPIPEVRRAAAAAYCAALPASAGKARKLLRSDKVRPALLALVGAKGGSPGELQELRRCLALLKERAALRALNERLRQRRGRGR